VANAEDDQRNSGSQGAGQAEGVETFNGVAAITEFFDDAGAHNDDGHQPGWQLLERFRGRAAGEAWFTTSRTMSAPKSERKRPIQVAPGTFLSHGGSGANRDNGATGSVVMLPMRCRN
jgi:hypothetical protein